MINPKGFSAAAAMALVLATAAPTAGLAEYKSNIGGNIRAGGNYRPPAAPYRGASAAGVPAAGTSRAAAPLVQPSGVYRGGYGGGYNGGYRVDRERDHDRDRRAFVAGGIAGVIIGGGAVVSPGYGYYGAPVYFGPGYYADQYDNGGPAVTPAPVANDAVDYCMQTYSSYDPQSGTYIGDDGLPHPCP